MGCKYFPHLSRSNLGKIRPILKPQKPKQKPLTKFTLSGQQVRHTFISNNKGNPNKKLNK